MRTGLSDLEQHFSQQELDEAMDIVRQTTDYDIAEAEAGRYHCVSKSPPWHVEITVGTEGEALAKCHCPTYRRSGKCPHTLPALLLFRDKLFKLTRPYSAARRDKPLVDEVLKKLNQHELRRYIENYATSHHGFRQELLAHFLHVLEDPDYNRLLSNALPVDKYGKFKINRNNLKPIRLLASNLLHQAQEMIRVRDYDKAWRIIRAVLPFQYRLIHKLPQYRDQWTTELRFALRLFDLLCQQSIAPAMQEQVVAFALELSAREYYFIVPGQVSVTASVSPWIIGDELRKEALSIAENKLTQDFASQRDWAILILHWLYQWEMHPLDATTLPWLREHLSDVVAELQRLRKHEELLYTLDLVARPTDPAELLRAGLKAAAATGEKPAQIHWATVLSRYHGDQAAWEALYTFDKKIALTVLDEVANPIEHAIPEAHIAMLLHGRIRTGRLDLALEILQNSTSPEWLPQYDEFFLPEYQSDIANLYARQICQIRGAFGGEVARQKLSAIFDRLEVIGLYDEATAKAEAMEQESTTRLINESGIQGFIFDLDGVIVDTATYHFQAWRSIMRELGTVIVDEDDQHTRGASRMDSFQYLLDKYGVVLDEEKKIEMADRKNQRYLEFINQITPDDLLPGVDHFLKASREAGLKISLGSASKNALAVLDKLGIRDQFDAIIDGNQVVHSKPDPEVFTNACEALGIAPEAAVVFEDAPKGVQAAMAAGCKVVGIGDRENLAAADLVISGLHAAEPADIITWLTPKPATTP